VNVVMNLWVPYSVGNFSSSSGPVSFSGRLLLHGVCSLEQGQVVGCMNLMVQGSNPDMGKIFRNCPDRP
jgi:hypothetical protein